ncbi:MAG: DNA topoisomerase [Nanoarchaeota archaeon]
MAVKDFLTISDAKQTVEKIVPEKPSLAELTTIESPGRPTPANMLEEKTSKKIRKSKRKNYEKSNDIEILESKKDSILIITEKPQAAEKIANALGNPRKISQVGVNYYELEKDGKKIIVASAVGHLFNLTYKEGQKGWPIFELEWKPSYLRSSSAFTKRYFDLLKRLSRRAIDIILATDFDIEGEVIGWNVLRFICQKENAKRMKFSTLTAPELKNSYDSPLSELNWGNAYAGETRHYIDWLYGINLSRALMDSLKKNGSFKIMSIGRVQGPALKIIIDREREIQNFKSLPFWQIFAICNNKEDILELKHTKDIFDKSLLEIFKDIKEGIAETKKTEELIAPPHPFDLTTLQREAYRLYKISPSETLSTAQKLYLDGLISYPRTSSQKIPLTIEPKKILKALEKNFPEAKLVNRVKPIEGKKTDPAHPSIYPTGEFAQLSGKEEKLYSLIAKRFIAAFSPDAKTANKKITLRALNKNEKFMSYSIVEDEKQDENILYLQKVKDEESSEIESETDLKENANTFDKEKKTREIPVTFAAYGLTVLDKGWTSFYPIKLDDLILPDLDGKVKVDKINIEEKQTQPPPRFTPTSLISLLERKNLGTKATRSMIVDTLFERGYLDGRSIQATPLGIRLIESLEKYSPIIIDENLTRQLEEEMEKIQSSKSNFKKMEFDVLEKTKRLISDIAKELKSKEIEIGRELMKGIEHQRNEQIQNNTLMLCPSCKIGNLRILYSKKTRRYFVACSDYPKCTQTYSLPPNALIKKAESQCNADSFPKLLAIRKGKRPWEFCFNPQCPIETQKRTERENNKNEENKRY